MRATNIHWDTRISMPDSIEIPEHIAIRPFSEIEEAISDCLSDRTGFCHKGFSLESHFLSDGELLGFDAKKMRYNLFSFAQTEEGKGLDHDKIEKFFDEYKRAKITTVTLIDHVYHEVEKARMNNVSYEELAEMLVDYIDTYGDFYEIADQMEAGETRAEFLERLKATTAESLNTTDGIVDILTFLEQEDNPEADRLIRILLKRLKNRRNNNG